MPRALLIEAVQLSSLQLVCKEVSQMARRAGGGCHSSLSKHLSESFREAAAASGARRSLRHISQGPAVWLSEFSWSGGPLAHVPRTLKLQPRVLPTRKAPRAEANADLAKEAKSRLQRTRRFCQLHSAVTRSDGQEHSAQQLLGKRQTPLLRTHPAMSKQPRKHILYWFPLLGQDLT